MKKVEISYNPYKMITKMAIDGINVCADDTYAKFKMFIEQGTPLQTWVEPITYLDWEGFVNELSPDDRNDEVTIEFSGRKIDFDDLKRAIKDQNEERSERTRVVYKFVHKKKLDDKVLSKNIDEVVKELQSKKFKELVESRTGLGLTEKYNDLETNYAVAKESECYIVLAGVYSSGKSTFLNTLIRHNVLPTSSRTCTSKNCRIRHDGSLGEKISLACYDANNEMVGDRKIFDNDADCAAVFEEICPINGINDKYATVEMMELGVDLSHLYPDSVSEDKFTIVLIDTPGMDSAQSSQDGKNVHAEIALEAISMDSKPMIILCADANKYEDKSIGEFMREIIAQSKEEGGGFNDRFLFLMNKSDGINYKSNESAEDAKADFAEYLTDSTKWNIQGDNEELKAIAESASRFVPRVFMTAARMAFAIQCKAHEFTDEELDDSDKYDLADQLESFKKKICGRKRFVNFYLSRYCDIPNYRKDEIEQEFEGALEDEDDIRATELQCGLVSVESAIRDYIERYAYPVKVRGLLDTFEDILEDVDDFTNGVLAELKKAERDLGEKSSEREEAQGRKKDANEKIAVLEKAKARATEQLKSLDKIVFNAASLKRAVSEFRADIDGDSEIVFIRTNDKVSTGQKSNDEVLQEIERRTSHIKGLFDRTIRQTNEKLESIKAEHDSQLVDIFEVLKDIVKELESSEIFRQGEYDFTRSVSWKKDFASIDSKGFADALKKKVVSKTTKQVQEKNYKKADWGSSWNPFKRIGSWFMDDYKTVTKSVDGYYETTEMRHSIDEYMFEMQKQCDAMKKEFEAILDGSKDEVRNMTERLLGELQRFLTDIKNQEIRIADLSSSISDLTKEIESYTVTKNWLSALKNKIEGE